MSKASTWTFPYPVSTILTRARAKARHHHERLVFWEEQVESTKKGLKEEAILFQESAQSGVTSTRYIQQPAFDTSKMRAFQEATDKVAHHRAEASRFERWVTILAQAPQDTLLDLDFDDAVFFGVGDTV